MEYPEKSSLDDLLSSTLRFGSDEERNCCSSCELSGKIVNSKGYCKTCRLYLCCNCITAHQTAASTKNHTVDKNPTSYSITLATDELQKCSKHPKEEVIFYCRSHGELGCVVCIRLSHKICEIDHIPEVSEQFIRHDDYLEFEENMTELKGRCAVNLKQLDANEDYVETTYENVISSIDKMKKEINDKLDEFEQVLKEEITKYRQHNSDQMKSLKKAYDAIVEGIVDTEETIHCLKRDGKFNSLYCKIRQELAKIEEYQSEAYELSTRLYVQNCEFKKTIDLQNILNKETMFGTININDNDMSPRNAPETVNSNTVYHINIKGIDDIKTCYATGLAFMSSDQLAIADKANRKVKVVDVSYDKIISEIMLSSSPRDITYVPPNQLAVTLRDEKLIQLLSTETGLVKTEQIQTDGNCRGIRYDDGKLIVAYDSPVRPKVEILSLNGEVLCKFQFSQSGDLLVKEPKCIGLSPDHNHMYVTDLSNMNVLRLSRLGIVKGLYGRHNFMGVAVSSGGSVYACSKSGSAIYQLSDDLSNDKVVLNINNGINGPIALTISNTRNMLYVSCGGSNADICNKLHVFKINKNCL